MLPLKRKRVGLDSDCRKTPMGREIYVCKSRLASVPPVTTELSAEKVTRIETLKLRFADTIEIAKQKLGLNDEKRSYVSMAAPTNLKGFSIGRSGPKDISRKRKTETEIRIATLRANFELKKQRIEKEREAARIAIEKVVKTFEFDDGLAIQREFEKLLFSNVSYRRDVVEIVMEEELEEGEITS